MDIKKIRELVDLMEEKDLLNLEYGHDDKYISLTRNTQVQTVAVAPVSTPVAADNSHSVAKKTTVSGKIETAPMVGVFYSAPSPNDPPFVKVGQKVEAGDTLGIIEAMKIMNPLEATQSGIIEEILVSNAEVVEFGQPIIRYKA